MKRKATILGITVLIAAFFCFAATEIYLSCKEYTGEDFGISRYVSSADRDGDGTDDQTDILQNARAYVAGKPQYMSKYYGTGYPDDGYGVCTDVVAFALRDAGYDLMTLVEEHILSHRELYEIDMPDGKIDFRRVRNLKVYFDQTAISLSTDPRDISQWQGGDIVVFEGHIGIVSDLRNRKGVPLVIHHGYPGQSDYEEDILGKAKEKILGHYRIS